MRTSTVPALVYPPKTLNPAAQGSRDPTRLGRRDPEPPQQLPRVRLLARRLVPMEATEVTSQYHEGGVVDVGNEGDGTSTRPARDDEPGSSHRPAA